MVTEEEAEGRRNICT